MSLDNKINYGDFDKVVNDLQVDYEIKKAEYKEAKKIDVNKAFSPERAATVIKTAILAAAFFIAFHLTNATLRLVAGIGNALEIPNGDSESEADPKKLARLFVLNPKRAFELGYKTADGDNVVDKAVNMAGLVVNVAGHVVNNIGQKASNAVDHFVKCVTVKK